MSGVRGADLETAIETLFRDPEARSRNRHFEQFRNPRDAYARRVALFLLDLRATLRRLPIGAVLILHEPTVRVGRGRVRLSYTDPGVGISRVVFLTEQELRLLAEDPCVAEHLCLSAEEAAP